MGLKSLPSSWRNMSETDSRSGVFFNMPRLERFFSLHGVYYCNCLFISHARAERGVKQLPITSSSLRSSLAGLNWHLTITDAILDYSLSSGCIIMSRSSSSGFISSDGKNSPFPKTILQYTIELCTSFGTPGQNTDCVEFCRVKKK